MPRRDDVIDALAAFTPDAGRLDRDDLLFRAGRASARPNRWWQRLAAALAVSQAATLVALAPRPTPVPPVAPDRRDAPRPAAAPFPPPPVDSDPSPDPVPGSYAALRDSVATGRLPPVPPAADGLHVSDRPLTVLSARSGVFD